MVWLRNSSRLKAMDSNSNLTVIGQSNTRTAFKSHWLINDSGGSTRALALRPDSTNQFMIFYYSINNHDL